MMSDILKQIDVVVRCERCGEFSTSADVIAESQRLLSGGCPGSPHECAAEIYATLLDPHKLRALSRAWNEVKRDAQRRATDLQIRSRLCIEVAKSDADGAQPTA